MSTINSGDTAFVLACAALVMIMTPGLALFYGGLVRGKNVLNTIMQCFIMLGIASVIWAFIGYSLAFAPDRFAGLIGDLNYVALKGVGQAPNVTYSSTLPHLVFMIFQAMFAIITPALITGAIVERMKFISFVLFISMWIILVYAPLAHWIWGEGGWIRELGALDFAGGTVVHINSAAAALAAAIFVGRRKGFLKESFHPHNIPMTVIGAGILWFGWFGFNAGSALSANGLAASAFVTTHLAAGSAAISWIFIEKLKTGKPTTLGAASGAIAGLVAITPASGFVGPIAAIVIGTAAGILCYLALSLKFSFKFDDSLDVIAIHGVGGILGAILTGVFASTKINEAGANGLLFGNPFLIVAQGVAVAATIGFSFVISFIILYIIHSFIGLRVGEDEEVSGLDFSQHNETAYLFEGLHESEPEILTSEKEFREESKITFKTSPRNG